MHFFPHQISVTPTHDTSRIAIFLNLKVGKNLYVDQQFGMGVMSTTHPSPPMHHFGVRLLHQTCLSPTNTSIYLTFLHFTIRLAAQQKGVEFRTLAHIKPMTLNMPLRGLAMVASSLVL
jgi:hypothetical protein